MLIRRYSAGNREAVRRLHDEALHDVGAHLGEGPWDEDLGRIESEYLHDGGEFLVGELDGRLVAMGALKRDSEKQAELKRMRVDPAMQRRGLGRKMLEELEDRARGLGYSTLHLDTAVQQTAAHRLYASSGYRETGRGRIGPFDCVFYEKELV